jgi:GT2 family glycosyltransferase
MLSVLIVNWNTREQLLACLSSLRENPPERPCEVIVVDNASNDGSASAVVERFPEVTLISAAANLGYATGNNLAFGAAKGEFLLTLNPDTTVFEDTLDAAVEALEEHSECGALGARLIGEDGETQSSVRGFPTFIGILGDVTGLGRILPHSAFGSYRLLSFDYETEQPAPQPMGTFLLFRRSALERVGDPAQPFDEDFPIFFNEVDLLYRLREAGFPCLYSPLVRVRHLGAASTRQVRKAMIWESHRSLLRFFRKHYMTPLNRIFFPLFAALVLGAAFVRARGWHAGFRA